MTKLTWKKPEDAIKQKHVWQTPSSVVPGHRVGLEDPTVPSGVGVNYLCQPGELEGGVGGPQTPCVPWMCTGLANLSPSLASPYCTTCGAMMLHSRGLAVRSFR